MSDSDTDSDTGHAEPYPDLSSSIFRPYLESTNQSSLSTSSPDLSKIKSFLTSSSSGALSCLICLERIRPSDPTWHCSSLCYSLFHLICIQSWARQASDLSAARAASRLPISADKAAECSTWNCPKCRFEYSKSQLPKKYLCFCGKLEDPYSEDPWILPHSCGEMFVVADSKTFLATEPVRNRWIVSHISVYKSATTGPARLVKRGPSTSVNVGRLNRRGSVGKRTCPCGKRVYDGMPCDVDVPLCGSTCDKMLSCGLHRCPERCHRGSCIETCRTVINKLCKCRSLKKEVPCCQDLACERKCQKVRDCGRHACKRRCCDGDCPPCSEICGKRLRCKNHKCPSPCHRGPCAPCPLMVTISCACGEKHFEVPCGTEMDQKPPRCRKLCHITPLCRHASITKPHKCHYGACPPCRLICEEEFTCGHNCKLRCHGPRPPPNPEFTLKPKKKKSNHPSELTPGSPCPACPELVWRSCVGQHIGAERMMVCSDRTQFSCDNLCGNPLSCGNHYCTKTCHAFKSRSSSSVEERSKESCEACNLPCQKERMPACPHPCPKRCHPGECSPCKVLIKRSCHCGAMVHVFECTYYNTLPEKEQITVRSCGGPCHRKLPYCTHLCPEICHLGQCPSPEKCCKKVTVRCGCQTLKKEWICQDVQAAYRKTGCDPKDTSKNQFGLGLLPCNSDCKSKIQVVHAELQARKPKVSEEKEKHVPKRKKRRERVQEVKQVSRLQKIITTVKWLFLYVALLVAIIATSYYGYKGLMKLNDWMNEVEEQRQIFYLIHSNLSVSLERACIPLNTRYNNCLLWKIKDFGWGLLPPSYQEFVCLCLEKALYSVGQGRHGRTY
ncbi:hypothetical protein Q3G72_000358 [Acer saccharum]|nr:hypothetical protein Q3G72_000358 [Acer saccharum]